MKTFFIGVFALCFLFVSDLKSQDGDPMPVELSSFEVEQNNNHGNFQNGNTAFVYWSTDVEVNNDRFELQTSTNGQDFKTVAVVKGSGSFSNYSELVNIEANRVYFRLVQYDFDGSENVHRVILKDFDLVTKFKVFDFNGDFIGEFDNFNELPKGKLIICNGSFLQVSQL